MTRRLLEPDEQAAAIRAVAVERIVEAVDRCHLPPAVHARVVRVLTDDLADTVARGMQAIIDNTKVT